jgi:hypothetical protein
LLLFFKKEVLSFSFMPLHLIKLSVGAKSLEDLSRWQQSREPPLKHQTRNMPRRAADIVGGGSIYWVINRFITARQQIIGIEEGAREDGTACTNLLLDQTLVPVLGRPVKPFQGWRYLRHEDAPPDATAGSGGVQHLPEAMRRDLASLGLL